MIVELTKECPMCGGEVESTTHYILRDLTVLRCVKCDVMSVVGGDAWYGIPYGPDFADMARRVHEAKKQSGLMATMNNAPMVAKALNLNDEQMAQFKAGIEKSLGSGVSRVLFVRDDGTTEETGIVVNPPWPEEPTQGTWRDRKPLL